MIDLRIEPWRKAWREGISPHVAIEGLRALAAALERDDQNVLQGSTTMPPPLMTVAEWPCEGGCPVAYMAWKGKELTTVGEVDEEFTRICFESDSAIGPDGTRIFLNWVDDTPRKKMRELLLAEVQANIMLHEIFGPVA